MTTKHFTYGESALLTPANLLTAFRLVVAPIFIWLVVAMGVSWWTFSVGGVLASSDYFDGIVARRQGPTSSGAFLDPLADKVAVLGAMFALVAIGKMWLVPVLLITAREAWMTWFRTRAGRSIPARSLPKVKTLVQDLAIALCVFPPSASQHALQVVMIWLAVALTLYTGGQYYLDSKRAAIA